MKTRLLALLAVSLAAVACGSAESDEASSADSDIISDILSMTRNDDGTFRVQCLDRATGNPYTEERVTGDEIQSNKVCKRTAPTPTVSARGSYTCAGNAEVIGQILKADGTEQSFRSPTGNWDTCRAVAAKLTQTRAVISATNLIAVCGGNAEVSRYAITQAGDVHALSKIATGNWDTCRAMQNSINDATATVNAVRGSFVCAGNAEVMAQFLSPDGTEKTVSAPTGNWDACRAVATTLNQTRATITDLSIFAICGGNAEVRRFSVTATGDVRELEKIATGNWDTCRAKQAELNR